MHKILGGDNSGGNDDELSVSTTTETTTSRKMDTLVIKRWVFILLVMALLFTVSLFLGISLQHLQLVRKYFATATTSSDEATAASATTTTTTTTATATAATSSTPVIYNSEISTEESIILNLLSIESSSQGSLMRP